MEHPTNLSLIKNPGSELISSRSTAGRALTKMVSQSLDTARAVIDESDDPVLIHQKAENYYYGIDVPEDHAEAVRLLSKAADAGHIKSQLMLGTCYDRGHGVEGDPVQAEKWFLRAAESGDAESQDTIGEFYWSIVDWSGGACRFPRRVEGEQWYRKATESYRKLAESGVVRAQVELGARHRHGTRCASKDYAEAVKWFHEAAAAGDEVAQWYMGDLYYCGLGLPTDFAEAVKWFRRSAAAGKHLAFGSLATCYLRGFGVAQDFAEAARLLKMTRPMPLSVLGRHFLAIDAALAYLWFKLASDAGEEEGASSLKKLAYEVSPTEQQDGEFLYAQIKSAS